MSYMDVHYVVAVYKVINALLCVHIKSIRIRFSAFIKYKRSGSRIFLQSTLFLPLSVWVGYFEKGFGEFEISRDSHPLCSEKVWVEIKFDFRKNSESWATEEGRFRTYCLSLYMFLLLSAICQVPAQDAAAAPGGPPMGLPETPIPSMGPEELMGDGIITMSNAFRVLTATCVTALIVGRAMIIQWLMWKQSDEGVQ